MKARLNRILTDEQVADILATLLASKPVKILKTIARTGKNASSVPWVYFENLITGDRASTFISFEDLLGNFWIWLETIEIMTLAIAQRNAISKAVWNCIKVGDRLYSLLHGWVTVVDLELNENTIPIVCLDTGERLTKVEACFLLL